MVHLCLKNYYFITKCISNVFSTPLMMVSTGPSARQYLGSDSNAGTEELPLELLHLELVKNVLNKATVNERLKVVEDSSESHGWLTDIGMLVQPLLH